jgi:hypothetical protein
MCLLALFVFHSPTFVLPVSLFSSFPLSPSQAREDAIQGVVRTAVLTKYGVVVETVEERNGWPWERIVVDMDHFTQTAIKVKILSKRVFVVLLFSAFGVITSTVACILVTSTTFLSSSAFIACFLSCQKGAAGSIAS